MTFSISAQTISNPSDTAKENILKKISKKLSYEVRVGSSFYSDAKHFNASSIDVTPIVNLNLRSKIKLFAGTSFVSTQVFGNKSTNSENIAAPNNNDKRFYSNFLILGGSYDVTKRLTVSGNVFSQTQIFNLKSFSDNFKDAAKGISLGVNYKVTEKSSIGIQVQFHDGSNFDTYRNFNNNPLFDSNSFNYSGFSRNGHTW